MGKATAWKPIFLDFLSRVQITSKDTGKGPLVPFQSQLMFLDELCEGLDRGVRHFVALKARQLGISTFLLPLDVFWLSMFPGIQGALIADTSDNKEIFRGTIASFLEDLPPGFKVPVAKHNRNELVLSNGSRLQYMNAGKQKNSGLGRSRALNFVHATEVSSWGDPKGVDSLEASMSTEYPNRLYMFESPLALDTPIPTPKGWTTMGEINAGDQVFNEEGDVCRVVGTSPVFHDRKCFRITFDNGDSIVADAGHTWRVVERKWPTNPQWRTRDLPTCGLDPDKHVIYVTKPLNLPDRVLPIDPYLLGVWLGDGNSRVPRITAANDDLEDMCELLVQRGHHIGTITRAENRAPMFTVLGEKAAFQSLDLIMNKHIPPEYLRASVSQRRELLAGLMDTDGSVDKKTFGCNFTSTNMELLSGVSELLCSLGIKHVESQNSVDGKTRTFPQGHTSVCKASRRLLFSELPDRKVFNLPRKRTVQETPRNQIWRKTKRLRISSIEEITSVPVKCIAVDTPSHLFLAGRTMVPTHNTALGYNMFYDEWRKAVDSPARKAFFIGWWAKDSYSLKLGTPEYAKFWESNPELDEDELETQSIVLAQHGYLIKPEQFAWYRMKAADASSLESLREEFPATVKEAFQVTGASFFNLKRVGGDIDTISALQIGFKGYRVELGETFNKLKVRATESLSEVDLRVWEEPKPNGKYVMGVDPAYGSSENADRSVISVWRCYSDKLVQVAEYATPEPESQQCAWVMAYLAACYKDCMINLELTGPGRQIMSEIKYIKLQVKHGPVAKEIDEIGKGEAMDAMRWFLWKKVDSLGGGFAYNWQTTSQTKITMFNRMRDLYNTQLLICRSIPLLNEMMTLVQEGDAIQASGRNKDDRAFAAGLACYAWVEWVRNGMMTEDRTFERESALDRARVEHKPGDVVSAIIPNFFAKAAMQRTVAEMRAILEG